MKIFLPLALERELLDRFGQAGTAQMLTKLLAVISKNDTLSDALQHSENFAAYDAPNWMDEEALRKTVSGLRNQAKFREKTIDKYSRRISALEMAVEAKSEEITELNQQLNNARQGDQRGAGYGNRLEALQEALSAAQARVQELENRPDPEPVVREVEVPVVKEKVIERLGPERIVERVVEKEVEVIREVEVVQEIEVEKIVMPDEAVMARQISEAAARLVADRLNPDNLQEAMLDLIRERRLLSPHGVKQVMAMGSDEIEATIAAISKRVVR